MVLEIDNEKYDVEIIKKRTTRNTYIRVNSELKIIVTTNIFVSTSEIKKIVEGNIPSIRRMINITKKKNEYSSKFYYFGRKYDVVYTNSKGLIFGENKVFVGKNTNIEKELKKIAESIFLERLNFFYNNFTYNIPYPSLTIRKMTSRWGVCNVKTKRVTLNLELIKKDPICLDYVIVHELSHLIEANHSNAFWNIVSENFKDYKKVRKILKEY